MSRDVLTPAMKHVILRCSEAERWEQDGRTFPRWWTDLIAQRPRTSMQTVRALVARGLLYEDDHGAGFGLTTQGISVWLSLRSDQIVARRDAATSAFDQLRPYLRHDGLCAAVGGYGFCSCGLEAAKERVTEFTKGDAK